MVSFAKSGSTKFMCEARKRRDKSMYSLPEEEVKIDA